MPQEPLSRRQVELILRRTAELESKEKGGSDDLITTTDLEKVAADLGLPAEALRQAIAESKAGVLAEPGEKGAIDKLIGERFIEVRRFVPGPLASVRAAVEGFLETQGFQKRRHQGEVGTWEAASDMKSAMRRAFKAGPYRLPREVEIEVRVSALAGGPHPVLVQLRVDTSKGRNTRVGVAVGLGVASVAGAIAGVALLPTLPLDLLAASGGAVLTGLGGLGARAAHKGSLETTEVALQRFLDFLEHEPAQLSAPGGKDFMSKVMSFLSEEWWK